MPGVPAYHRESPFAGKVQAVLTYCASETRRSHAKSLCALNYFVKPWRDNILTFS